MAQYFLSQNPTISNFGASNTTQDTFVIDDTSDSSLSINQIGTDVVVTDGTNTATFDNFTLEQFTSFVNDQQIFNTFDGSRIIIGTATPEQIFDTTDGLPPNGVNGSTTNDYIAGLAGNDSIAGGSGSDVIYGNQGDDQISNFLGTGAGNDTVFGGQGNDLVELGGTGNNIIYGNFGNDILVAVSNGNDILFGGQGSDLLYNLVGNSTMSGGLGDDIIHGEGSNPTSTNLIYGNQGNDQILGFGLKDTVYGGQGNDIINYDDAPTANVIAPDGTSAALIYGNFGNDIITGSTAGDTLFGGQGDDLIVGNINGVANTAGATAVSGHDVMTGGLGADTFVQTAATTGTTTATADVITDFVSGTDKIEGSTAGTQANFSSFLANGQNGGAAVTTADQAATFGGLNTYVFVAGQTDGYLVETDGGGNVGVTTLTGDNSITSLKFTDIIAGADTVPGGGTVA